MTLLVGILCEGGVVIACDSAATFGSMGKHTISQSTVKVEVIRGEALIATSGAVGLSQRLAAELDDIIGERRLGPVTKSVKAMPILRAAFFTHVRPELEAAQAAVPVVGQDAAAPPAIQSTLVAMCVGGRPCLFQFDHQCAPEEATPNLPFVCLGSGQANADPFLAFLKGIFWDEGTLPSVANAIFAAVWTVQQSINIAPGGLGGPVRVYVLRGDGKACEASQLSDGELQEAQQAVSDARATLSDWGRMEQPAPELPKK